MPTDQESVAFDPAYFLAHPGPGRTIVKYRAHHVVYSQGDIAYAVYYLQSGMAKLTFTCRDGKEVVLSILGPGDFFGDRCLTGQIPRTATVATVTECAMMQVDKGVMLATLRDEPAFSAYFIRHLLERHIRVGSDLVDHLIHSSEIRLARALLQLAKLHTDNTPEPVIPKISHETLAEIVGTTRSRVTFFMNKFRRLGFIEYNGVIHVHSSLSKVVLADGH